MSSSLSSYLPTFSPLPPHLYKSLVHARITSNTTGSTLTLPTLLLAVPSALLLLYTSLTLRAKRPITHQIVILVIPTTTAILVTQTAPWILGIALAAGIMGMMLKPEIEERKEKMKRHTGLTNLRGYITFLTVLCILAVDFKIFET